MIKFKDGDGWFVTYGIPRGDDEVTVTMDDPLVTTQALLDCWQSKLEGENYHSMMDVPENFVSVLRDICHVDEPTIKRALWEVLENQGGWI